MYIQLNASGSFPKATHIRSEPLRQKKQPKGTENRIEDLMGRVLTLYQDEIKSFSEARFNLYEKNIRRAVMKEKIGSTLIISKEKNEDRIIMSVALEIKKYLPSMEIENIANDVEKEIEKMEITE